MSNVAIPFYRNIVCKNIVCEQGLRKTNITSVKLVYNDHTQQWGLLVPGCCSSEFIFHLKIHGRDGLYSSSVLTVYLISKSFLVFCILSFLVWKNKVFLRLLNIKRRHSRYLVGKKRKKTYTDQIKQEKLNRSNWLLSHHLVSQAFLKQQLIFFKLIFTISFTEWGNESLCSCSSPQMI